MQKIFDKQGFPARVGPVPFLSLALLSQVGMSVVQQGLVILGSFFLTVYHLNLAQLGVVTTALSLGVMVSMVFVGAVVDRLGPRVVLGFGAALMAVFSLVLLSAKTFPALLLVLFCVGIALAITPASGTKAVFVAFANRPRGLVMGIRQTGVPIGAALSAWLLPRFTAHLGLPKIYDFFAIELLVTGWAFSTAMQRWQKPSIAAKQVHFQSSEWRRLLRPLLVAFLMVSGQYILLTYSITDLNRIHHLSVALAGIALAISQVGGGLGRIILGQISDWVGGRPPVIASVAALGAVLSFITGAIPGNAPFGLLLVLWGCLGFATVGWNALVLTWAAESVSPQHSGFAMGLTGSTVFLGSSVFPPLFGIVVDASHHMALGWWMLTCVLLIPCIIALASSKAGSWRVVEHD